jgi:hypothetical protein
MKAAREEVLPVSWNAIGDPIADCCSGLFGDFELDRSAGFPLDYRGAVPDSAPDAHVVDLEPHEAIDASKSFARAAKLGSTSPLCSC